MFIYNRPYPSGNILIYLFHVCLHELCVRKTVIVYSRSIFRLPQKLKRKQKKHKKKLPIFYFSNISSFTDTISKVKIIFRFSPGEKHPNPKLRVLKKILPNEKINLLYHRSGVDELLKVKAESLNDFVLHSFNQMTIKPSVQTFHLD